MNARRFFYVCVISLSIGCFTALVAPARAQTGEVAILTGVLPSGATIPLPSYADGTPAMETECHWFVSINTSSFHGATGAASLERCFTEGRVITTYRCESGLCGGSSDPSFGTANYMIIAVRAGAPTPTRAGTWSQVKARYRNTPSISVSPGAQNK